MKKSIRDASRFAVLAFAEIKASVEDFEGGDSNLFDALDRVKAALALVENAENSRRQAA